MKRRAGLPPAILVGTIIGVWAITGLHAQGKPAGAYVIDDISEITDPDAFKTLIPKAPAAIAAFGGHLVVQTQSTVADDGVPPKRFVIIAFDSMDKAKAFCASAAQKEISAIRNKSAKARQFIVEALPN